MKKERWNPALGITLSRILITPVFLWCLFQDVWWGPFAAGILFVWGAYSDYLDGFLARTRGWKTDLGALLDPLADKILTLSALLAFVQMDLAPAWMVLIITAREFLVTGLRQLAQSRGVVIAAGRGGKHKMISQIVVISVILAILCVRAIFAAGGERLEIGLARLGTFGEWLQHLLVAAPYWLLFYTTVVALVSGLDYFLKNKHVWGGHKTS